MRPVALILLSLLVFTPCYQADAQLKNLGKRIKNKVNERVNRRFDQGVDKGLDEVEKGVGGTVAGEGDSPTEVQNGGAEPAATSTAAAAEATAMSNSSDFQVFSYG